MATALFSDIGGAVSDLFAADANKTKAEEFGIKSQADLLKATADQYKEEGDLAEGSLYALSASYARENETFTAASTAIQSAQADRTAFLTIGGIKADVAGAGLSESGSALDILRDSASQAALSRAVGVQQGAITEAGQEEQAKSYDIMSNAANYAVKGDEIAEQIDNLSSQVDLKAQDAANEAAKGDDIGAVLKGAAAVADVFNLLPDADLGNSSIGNPTVAGALY